MFKICWNIMMWNDLVDFWLCNLKWENQNRKSSKKNMQVDFGEERLNNKQTKSGHVLTNDNKNLTKVITKISNEN